MKKGKEYDKTNILLVVLRIFAVLAAAGLILPVLNPANICRLSNGRLPLFASGFQYSRVTETFIRALRSGWVEQSTLSYCFFTSMIVCFGYFASIIGGCLTLGEVRLRKLSAFIIFIGNVISITGLSGLIITYYKLLSNGVPERVNPHISIGLKIMLPLVILSAIISLYALIKLKKPSKQDKYKMKPKYYLFLLLLPFLILTFSFSYLPIWSWIYGFFDLKPGLRISPHNFVGLKWFKYLFRTTPADTSVMGAFQDNISTRITMISVLKNTLAMSGLSLAVSWLAMVFAIAIAEIKSRKLRGILLALSAIPNFVSWVVIYIAAKSLFDYGGLINTLKSSQDYINYLFSNSHMWLKMAAYSTWKGLGWGAIIYMTAIMNIDKDLYEAARIDGAGKMNKLRYIMIPHLIPTFFVLLLISVAGIFSTGMDQSFIFSNLMNMNQIMVPDQYAFRLKFSAIAYFPLASIVSMVKSLLSIILLLAVNRMSKLFMKENIV